MKTRKAFPLLFVLCLSSCQNSGPIYDKTYYYFNSYANIKIYEDNALFADDILNIIDYYDQISDNFDLRDIVNVKSINESNDEIKIPHELYELLKTSFDVSDEGATYFNPLCGSLSNQWKASLLKKEVLSNEIIQEELQKVESSSLIFKEDDTVLRLGEAEIDLGGIAKGYTLDVIYNYLKDNNINKYLIDAGSSSILLGRKNTSNGLFTIEINDLSNSYLKLKDCFVSCSSISRQGVEIDGVTYSHIINPFTGSAINKNDAVIVINDKGYLGDALSTSMMLSTIDEIVALEESLKVKTIVIKDNKIIHKHEDIKIYH